MDPLDAYVWDGKEWVSVKRANVTAGGTTGQVYAKASDADYDTAWVDPPTSTGGMTITSSYLEPASPALGDFWIVQPTPFPTLPVTTDLFAWYDAEYPNGFDGAALSDGDPVATLTDLSGNSRDLTQSTAANRPLWKAASVGGKAALLFDGSNDSIANASMNVPGTKTYYIVVQKPTVGSGTDAYFVATTASSGRSDIAWFGSYALPYMWGSAQVDAASGTAVANQPIIIAAAFAASGGYISVNGGVTSGNAGAVTTAGFALGARVWNNDRYWTGHIACFIAYTGTHDATTRQTVETWLNARYGIGV